MLRFCVFLSFLAVSSAASRQYWAKEGESFGLDCPTKSKPQFCTWITPWSDSRELAWNNLGTGFEGKKEDEGCYIMFDTFEAKHAGTYKCQAWTSDKIEIETEVKLANISDSILLDDVYEQIDNETSRMEYRCLIGKSSPKPSFVWFIDDEELSYSVTDEETEEHFIQTLNYQPKKEHSNKTLKCVANFTEHGFEDLFEDSTLLEFSETEIATIVENEIANEVTEANTDMTSVIIGILVFVAVACCIVVAFAKTICKKKVENEVDGDAEAGAKAEEAEKTANDGDVTKEMTKESKFGDCLKFGFKENKSFVNDETTEEATTEETEEKKDEVKIPVEETELPNAEAEAEPAKKKNYFAFLSKMFKPRDVVADKTEEKTEAKKETEEKTEKKEEEIVKKEEENSEEEKKDDEPEKTEKEPTPNTSF